VDEEGSDVQTGPVLGYLYMFWKGTNPMGIGGDKYQDS